MATVVSPGAVAPRVLWHSEFQESSGREAVELAASAGLVLDEWEAEFLVPALAEGPDGRWVHQAVGTEVARQNGKGAIITARQLAGLFLLGDQLQIHSAHLFPTALEAFRRLLDAIEANPDMERRVSRVMRSHGEEGVELKGGQRVLFRARTKNAARGFSADCLILDEAMILADDAHAAMIPTLSARPNPQVWYLGSAVDQVVHQHGFVFARQRRRGLSGDPQMMWAEWSLDYASPDEVPDDVMCDPEVWARVNPGFGIRISEEAVRAELASMSRRSFIVERLGVGDWPEDSSGVQDAVIDVDVWRGLTDSGSRMVARRGLWLAVDVSPNRDVATVVAVGGRRDGRLHVEVVDRREGASWVVARVKELVARHEPDGVVCDGIGQAGALAYQLEDAGVDVTITDSRDMARACGVFFDLVQDAGVRHLGDQVLEDAVAGAARRNMGDAWAWARRASGVDITPLVAATLASWAFVDQPVAWEAV